MQTHSVFKNLLTGFVIRLPFAAFLGHPYDLRIFMAVGWAVAHNVTPYGQYALHEIFLNMPHPHLFETFPGIGYPPTWALLCGLMYLASACTNNIYVYTFALKVPIVLADLVAAYLIYRLLAWDVGEWKAFKVFRLFLFCPFILSIGVAWGMFDVIPLIFTLLSALYLPKRWKLSSVLLAVGSTFKQIPLVLIPTYSILSYKRYKSDKIALKYFFLSVSVFAAVTLAPMLLFGWSLTGMFNALSYGAVATAPPYKGVTSFPLGAASPFNIFLLLDAIQPNSNLQVPPVLSYLWIPACIAAYAYVLRKAENNVDIASIVQYSLLTMLVFFTTRTWVSEPNLIFLFVLFVMSAHMPVNFLMRARVLLKDFDYRSIHAMWILLFCFVMANVPVISFFWIISPWTLNAASAFADGPFGWTRLLVMSCLTFSWLVLGWRQVIRSLRGR